MRIRYKALWTDFSDLPTLKEILFTDLPLIYSSNICFSYGERTCAIRPVNRSDASCAAARVNGSAARVEGSSAGQALTERFRLLLFRSRDTRELRIQILAYKPKRTSLCFVSYVCAARYRARRASCSKSCNPTATFSGRAEKDGRKRRLIERISGAYSSQSCENAASSPRATVFSSRSSSSSKRPTKNHYGFMNIL